MAETRHPPLPLLIVLLLLLPLAGALNLYGPECYGGCFFTTCTGQTSFYVNAKADVAYRNSAICVKPYNSVRRALGLSRAEELVAAHSGESLRVRRTGPKRYDFDTMWSVHRALPPTLFKSYAVFRPRCKYGRHVFLNGRPQYVRTGRSGIGRQAFGGVRRAEKWARLANKCYILRINWFSVRNTKTGKVRHLQSKSTRSCVAFYAVLDDDDDNKDKDRERDAEMCKKD